MTEERKLELDNKCLQLRSDLIDLLHSIQTGHPGGSLSCTEILAALYYEIMNMDPENPNTEGRDRLILSKGHAAPMLYLILADKGYFPKEDLRRLRQLDSHLQGHPCVHKTPGIELSTGPLGLGLGAGIGMALGERLKESSAYIYVVMGDGEIQEGEIIKCEAVPKSKKLLCSQVKIGSQVRQILSGIKAYYSPEEMVGKKVMVVTNLKPAKLAGMVSEGMILCAEDAEGSLALMTPEKSMPAGAEIC